MSKNTKQFHCHLLSKFGALALVLFMQPDGAMAAQLQLKGQISNGLGKPCSYTQTTTHGVKYFHQLPGTHSTLTFTDPACMAGVGIDLDINKMMINHIVARWHSHSNPAFKTLPDQMYRTSPLQVRGQCIQSGKYPDIGIAIEYMIVKNSITQVKHAPTAGACQR